LSGIYIRPRERIISPGRKKYRHESENGGGNDGAGPGGVFGSMRQQYYVQHWCLTSTGLTYALVALSISIPYTIHGIDWTENIIRLPSRTADIYQVSCPKRLSACVPIVRKILRELLSRRRPSKTCVKKGHQCGLGLSLTIIWPRLLNYFVARRPGSNEILLSNASFDERWSKDGQPTGFLLILSNLAHFSRY
jgi:hypothetical protein